jgi:superfamily I DNA/RNA helicase
MSLSVQQEAVVNFALVADGHLNVVARAGCGKSYTLLAIVDAVMAQNQNNEVSLVAYNRAIALELQGRIAKGSYGKNVRAMTMHAAGASALRGYLLRMKNVVMQEPDDKKVERIVNNLKDECIAFSLRPGLTTAKMQEAQEKADICENQRGFVIKAVSLAKQRAFGVIHPVDQKEKWYELIEHFGLDEDWDEAEYKHSESMIKLCILVYNRSLDAIVKDGSIDYDDMIVGPLFYRAKFWEKQFVLVDEAQDLNPARRLLAMRMVGSNGRIIAVGDPAQAIYGFTGADSDSMDILKATLGSTELPLNMTYRCPKAVVRVAQQWVPDFQAHESNPEGVVRYMPLVAAVDADGQKLSKDFDDETNLTKDDAILCRNTKPLIEMAWSLIRRGIACRVEGRDIGQGLIGMAKRWKVTKLNAFKNRVEAWKDREVAKYVAKDKADMVQSVVDKADTIILIIDSLVAEGKQNVSDFEAFVATLFGDTKEGETAKVLTLSTVHKSKGREWKRVFILGMNKYMPSPYAKKPWQLEQEANLCYVAVTRSAYELVMLSV